MSNSERESAAPPKPRRKFKHNCQDELGNAGIDAGNAMDGEMWTCSCGLTYEHICDEAEGCMWTLVVLAKARRERGTDASS